MENREGANFSQIHGDSLWVSMITECVLKLGVQRSKMRGSIQENDIGQKREFFIPYCVITVVMHPVTVRDKFEHHSDLLGGVIRYLLRMKKLL